MAGSNQGYAPNDVQFAENMAGSKLTEEQLAIAICYKAFAAVEKEYGIGPQPSCSKNLEPYGPLQDGFARPAPAALLPTQLAMFPETANSTTVKIILHLFSFTVGKNISSNFE